MYNLYFPLFGPEKKTAKAQRLHKPMAIRGSTPPPVAHGPIIFPYVRDRDVNYVIRAKFFGGGDSPAQLLLAAMCYWHRHSGTNRHRGEEGADPDEERATSRGDPPCRLLLPG